MGPGGIRSGSLLMLLIYQPPCRENNHTVTWLPERRGSRQACRPPWTGMLCSKGWTSRRSFPDQAQVREADDAGKEALLATHQGRRLVRRHCSGASLACAVGEGLKPPPGALAWGRR